MISTYLFERNNLLREGLKSFLNGTEFSVTAEFANISELMDTDNHQSPELIIAGINRAGEMSPTDQPILEYIRLTKHLRTRFPSARLVILASAEDLPHLPDLMHCDTDGFLLRDMPPAAILSYLHLAIMGEKALPEAVALSFASSQPIASARPLIGAYFLSERENDILQCLALGESNKLIARHLEITESTVKVHLKAILRKMGVKNRTQAAILVAHQGNDNGFQQVERAQEAYAA